MVDMGRGAVTQRLQEVSRLLERRGAVVKAVEMSEPAIRARLKTQGALSDMCRRLAVLGDAARRTIGSGLER